MHFRILSGTIYKGLSQSMNGDKREEWMRLCELASKEQDPDRLMGLVQEITRLLDEREKLLKSRRTTVEGNPVNRA